MTQPRASPQSNLGLILGLIGGVAGITFFLYLVGVVVEFRRLKTLHLPTDQVVSALPRNLLLIIGVRSLVVPLILAAGAALLIALLSSGRGDEARPRALRGKTSLSARTLAAVSVTATLAAAAAAFIVVPGSDLRIEHGVLVGLVVAVGAGGWLAEKRRKRPTHAAGLVFLATSLAAAIVVYIHAMRAPIHFDAATIVETNGKQIRGFSLGQSADDIFLAPKINGNQACHFLLVVPVKQVASMSFSRSKAYRAKPQAYRAKPRTPSACARPEIRR